MNGSPPTIWRPGVVNAAEPAKGSESSVKVVALAVDESATNAPTAARSEHRMRSLPSMNEGWESRRAAKDPVILGSICNEDTRFATDTSGLHAARERCAGLMRPL